MNTVASMISRLPPELAWLTSIVIIVTAFLKLSDLGIRWAYAPHVRRAASDLSTLIRQLLGRLFALINPPDYPPLSRSWRIVVSFFHAITMYWFATLLLLLTTCLGIVLAADAAAIGPGHALGGCGFILVLLFAAKIACIEGFRERRRLRELTAGSVWAISISGTSRRSK